MKMILTAIVAAVLATAPGAAQAQPVSVYTKINEASCKTLQRAKPGEGEWSISRCPGRGGWQVFLDYDDAREQLRLKRAGQSYRLPHGVATFSSLGSVVEWRAPARGAPPNALIFRVRWKDQNTQKRRSRLMVVHLSPAGACVMGSVDSHMGDMNLRARHLADRHAAGFVCGRDAPAHVR